MATTEKSGGNRLVIVESPAKARTISGYLGDGFTVSSSVGHIRDLPSRASEVPKEKREKYGTMGVAIEDDFEPLYLVDKDKKKTVDDLKKQLKQADELLLATDEDREGEAIAWHLKEVLKPKVPVHRMVFHEITRDAIERSLEHTRDIDDRLVDAQETRRILDRLYGFEVSPVLWKKVTQGLSAGRVQSVATRLVVERERDRIAFVDVSYWDLEGIFDPGSFTARLVALDGKRVARGSDFGSDGKLKNDDDRPSRRERRTRARRAPRRGDVQRPQQGREAVHAPTDRAVPHSDAAAGGEPQAALLVADDHARRAAPVRERLHHLHAHRLDVALRSGRDGGAPAGDRALRRRLRPAEAADVPARGQERAGGARGDSSRR